MMRFARLVSLSPLLGLLGVAACGGDDPVEPEPETAVDLSGTYTLQSLSAIVTGGIQMTPPDVTGTFVAQQTATTGLEASGTADFTINLPDGQGGMATIAETGTYTNRVDGTWEQNGTLVQGRGTYELVGNILTVEVTEPALNVATTVWQRN